MQEVGEEKYLDPSMGLYILQEVVAVVETTQNLNVFDPLFHKNFY